MRKNPVILPYDGFQDANTLLRELENDLQNIEILELLSFVKFNDAMFLPPFSGPGWIVEFWKIMEKYTLYLDIGIFLDLKLADTSGTLKNIATHFFASFQQRVVKQKILTVRSNLSGKGYLEIRRVLPDVKIALVSFLTDNSEQDCLEQYGLFPEEKILHDMRIAQRKYERVRNDGDPQFAFDMVVCSPKELPYLMRNELPIFGKRFEKISPGIRDEWMAKGQQVRVAGVFQALKDGADYVVMGSQMKKGNPDKGISAEESRQRTKAEIERAFMEIGE
ncbi:MAG: orotidine 5'-phosphate decarboxylase / HUMPS family protein [Candidatus Falkowbacteria bacterium]